MLVFRYSLRELQTPCGFETPLYVSCLLELGAQHLQHVVDSLLFEVCLLNEHIARSVEHCLCCVETDALAAADI